jgi:hypothetical protein
MLSDGKIIHENEGVYYGTFQGEPGTVWVVSRGSKEYLLHINVNTGEVLDRKGVPSRFTHDAIRVKDKVYIADCGNGRVVVLDYPSMETHKIHSIFTVRNHINTLCYHEGVLWCLLHNLGPSQLVGIDPETGEKIKVYTDVGRESHGIVPWCSGFLVLNSLGGQLLHVTDLGTRVLFHEPGHFLKGICLIGNTVYFGSAPPMIRANRGDPKMKCQIVGVNLKTCTLVSRERLETKGLLNNLI